MQSARTRFRLVRLLLIASLAWWGTAPAAAQDHEDDFVAVRTLTVRFGDGKYDVSRSQKSQLQQLAAEAQAIQGYMISVAAYAPAAGSDPVDQKLSMQRASAITVVLRLAGIPVDSVPEGIAAGPRLARAGGKPCP